MTFVDMNSVQFYQPPKAGLHSDGRPTASNLRVPMASGDDNNPGALGPDKGPSGSYWKAKAYREVHAQHYTHSIKLLLVRC